MEELEELAYIVSSEKPSSLRFLVPKASKLRRLFLLAAKGEMISNEQAADWVYKAPPADKKFVMLKKNLLRKLTELVLLGEYKSMASHSYVELLFTGRKKLLIAEKLLLRNVYHNAERLARKMLHKSQNYHLLELQWEASLLLRRTYAMQGRSQLAGQLHEEVIALQQPLQQLMLVRGWVETAASRTKYCITAHAQHLSELKEQAARAFAYDKQYQNPFFKRYGIELSLVQATYANDFDLRVWALGQLGELMQDYPHVADDQLYINTELTWICWNTFTGRYREATMHLQKALAVTAYQAFDRFDVKIREWELAMHQGRWQVARDVLREICQVPQQAMLHETDQAAWCLRQGFWVLMVTRHQPGLLSEEPAWTSRTAEDWASLLQPLHRDKAGYQVLVIFFKLAMLRQQGDLERFYKECTALRTYARRHLEHLANPRVSFMVQLLVGLTPRKEEQLNWSELSQEIATLEPDQMELIPLQRLLGLLLPLQEVEQH